MVAVWMHTPVVALAYMDANGEIKAIFLRLNECEKG